MAEGYSRQATFIDGDVILAEHGNLEFDKLVNVFGESSGHNHDGTTGGGAAVPLIQDITGAQDITLTPTGVGGSVILDEDDLTSDSAQHLVTQQSVKAYVDTQRSELDVIDAGLQNQIDVFTAIPANHSHTNKDDLDDITSGDVTILQQLDQSDVDYLSAKQDITLRTSTFTMGITTHYKVVATSAAVDISIPALTVGEIYTTSNSLTSTELVRVLNPSYTIAAPVATVVAGDNIILEPGDTLSLLALTASTMEVI
jgi:hypothetical protein